MLIYQFKLKSGVSRFILCLHMSFSQRTVKCVIHLMYYSFFNENVGQRSI